MGNMVDSDKLNSLLGKLSDNTKKIKENTDYVSGKNPYIMNKAETKKPDNRMPVTLGKMAVDTMAGYAGKSGNIKVLYDLVDTDELDPDDPFIQYCREMDDFNDSDIEISELYDEGLKQGVAYEIWWTSEDVPLDTKGLLTTEYKIANNNEVIVVYSNDLKKKKLYAVHFSKDDKIETATVYYPKQNETWTRNRGGAEWKSSDTQETPFSTVPVNVYKINRMAECLFEAEKTFIDGIDEIISKSQNEVDRFNAAIALFGNSWEPGDIQKFKDGILSVISNLSESAENVFVPQYLEKNLTGVKEFYEMLVDRYEDWFRKSVGIADFSDEAFAGQQSGIAILFKLIPMEFRAAQIETYFNHGLNNRLRYYGDVYNASTASVNIDDYTTIIKSKRNIPVDSKSIIESAINLMGLGVSKETILEFLPEEIVPDAKKELERIEGTMVDVSDDPITGPAKTIKVVE